MGLKPVTISSNIQYYNLSYIKMISKSSFKGKNRSLFFFMLNGREFHEETPFTKKMCSCLLFYVLVAFVIQVIYQPTTQDNDLVRRRAYVICVCLL